MLPVHGHGTAADADSRGIKPILDQGGNSTVERGTTPVFQCHLDWMPCPEQEVDLMVDRLLLVRHDTLPPVLRRQGSSSRGGERGEEFGVRRGSPLSHSFFS